MHTLRTGGAVAGNRKRILTLDHAMMTYDRATIDSAGVFLISELERLDPTLNMPLAAYTWSRDIDLRTDVSMADELASFTNSSFAAAPGVPGSGKAWIGKDASAITGISLDIGKTAQALPLWGMQLGWTLPELESAQKLGRPVDSQKFEGMQLKYQMDVDEQVYLGDTALGSKGMLNHAGVTNVTNAPSGSTWAALIAANAATAPDIILNDVNEILASAYNAAATAVMPTDLRLPPTQFLTLASAKVSSAGNMSILKYLSENSACVAINGKPLNIQPLKWLTGTTLGGVGPGAAGKDRMLAYTKSKQYIRFPLVPLQRTPLEFRDLRQLTTYYGRLGSVELVYPETVAARDGI